MSHPIQKSHAIASAIVAVLNHNQDHLRTSKELIAKTKTQGKKVIRHKISWLIIA